ncbi:hypothetical protein [Pseudomonas defluvii]|uniref:hypothetical protein n=1 Tax=Pseudomonas defluvii TaxID=1876757 RepID=UPI0039059B2D
MINALTGVRVTFTETRDAKKIIGTAVRVKADDVIDKFWPQMTSAQILQCSTYLEDGQARSELKELIENLQRLVV